MAIPGQHNLLEDTTSSWALYHMGARYFQPSIYRWTQPDSNLTGHSVLDQDRYLFAADNPATNTDPTGASLLGDFFGAVDFTNVLFANTLQKQLGVLAGVAAGVLAETACNFVLGVLSVPSAGLAAVAGETFCTLGAAAAGTATERALG
jgi:RHS repeat-associated protein